MTERWKKFIRSPYAKAAMVIYVIAALAIYNYIGNPAGGILGCIVAAFFMFIPILFQDKIQSFRDKVFGWEKNEDPINEDLMGEIFNTQKYLEQNDRLSGTGRELEEYLDTAHRIVAERKGIPVDKLRAIVDAQIEKARKDPNASALEKSRAALHEKRLSDADYEADTALEKILAMLEKALALKKISDNKILKILPELFDAFKQKGLVLVALEKFEEAVAIYRRGSDLIPRENSPEQWAELQLLMGNAAAYSAKRSEGEAIKQRLEEAIQAYRAALTVRTREALPQDWAMTQNNLAVALRDQAKASEGENRAILLAEAVTACRAALTVRTREALPQDWATTQNNLAVALSDQANASEGENRAMLLAEAVTACRAALTVRTREDLPQGWAMTQNNLAVALRDQALDAEGKTEKAKLLRESIAAFNNALEIYTKEHFPENHQFSQNGLERSHRLLAELGK